MNFAEAGAAAVTIGVGVAKLVFAIQKALEAVGF